MGNINKEISQYIHEIANKMKNFRASVMVGAGFSINAEQTMPTKKRFLGWNSLGDIFYKKLHGCEPDTARYLNVLRLAEEVETAFGRTVLNQIIRDNLPDNEYSPSELHEKLLRLNWRDILTTNYDTLLERTQDKITDKHYDVVLSKEDLIYSKEPRIIKLHGSFPSTTPFIITEEDYRKYPKESAVFVNTVQQTLIENILCLIGFSGDDPNFLQWIGWIRDNLGKDIASKIYLIGVFDFSSAQIKLLEKRNIIILNMNTCDDVNMDHKKGLTLFLDELSRLTAENDPGDWPKEKTPHISFNDEKLNEKMKAVIEEWENTRITYPGWYITPYSQREKLQIQTKLYDVRSWGIKFKNVDKKIVFRMLYEYNWRNNRCLNPIPRDNIKIYKEIIYGVNPFPALLQINSDAVTYDNGDDTWNGLSVMWIELMTDLLRACRENGMFEECDKVIDVLKKVDSALSKEQAAKICCEKVRIALFQLNVKKANEYIQNWTYDITLPEWELQRAGLLMELGDLPQAQKIIIDELNYIRNSHSKDIDYYKITLEAHLANLALFANQAMWYSRGGKWDIGYTEYESILKRFNPYEEKRLFDVQLDNEIQDIKYEKEEFDLGQITKTIVACEPRGHLIAFRFLRYYENIGMPFSCNHIVNSSSAAIEAAKRINVYAPVWSLVLQILIKNNKVADKVWTRDVISKMTNEEIDEVSVICINAIERNYKDIENGKNIRETSFQLGIAELMPEIISRLCTRMSDKLKLETLNLLKMLLASEVSEQYKNISHLSRRLINSMSDDLKIQAFNDLINVPICVAKSEYERYRKSDIFVFFNYNRSKTKEYKAVSIDTECAKELINLMDQENYRSGAILRLELLYNFHLLDHEQIAQFTKKLWEKVDKNGLPIIEDVFSKAFLFCLPVPPEIDLDLLVKKYILSFNIPAETKGISFSGYNGSIFLTELYNCTYDFRHRKGLRWNNEEIDKIIDIVFEAWNKDKKGLNSFKDNLLEDEVMDIIREKYKSIDRTLAKALYTNDKYNFGNEKLKILSEDLKQFGLPYLQLMLLTNCKKDICNIGIIHDQLFGSNEEMIVDACETIYNLCVVKRESIGLEDLLEKISLSIKLRSNIGLSSMMGLMADLISSDILPSNDNLINNIIFGLEHLFHETKVDNNAFGYTVNQCTVMRKMAMSLAYMVYSKYEDERIRKRLSCWKDASEDLREFSEVKNSWIN